MKTTGRKEVNLNHTHGVYISKEECGRKYYKVKCGRKYYFLDIETNRNNSYIDRYEIGKENESKYSKNLISFHVNNNIIIDRSFVENMEKYYNAIMVLSPVKNKVHIV